MMPSRVEPCGLNQMYAMRYGTSRLSEPPAARKIRKDFGDPDGYGIRFNNAIVGDITHAIWRAVQLYQEPLLMEELRRRMMRWTLAGKPACNNTSNYMLRFNRIY
jgi:starch synthase